MLFDSYSYIAERGLTGFFLESLPYLVRFTERKGVSVFTGMPFEFILGLDPHQRGKLGENFVELLAKEFGFFVSMAKPGCGDRNIEGINTEIKFARQKEDGGFLVNQIRNQDYVYVVIVAMTPHKIELFTLPKSILIHHPSTVGQHGGNGATETRIYNARSFSQMVDDFGEFMGIDIFRSSYFGK